MNRTLTQKEYKQCKQALAYDRLKGAFCTGFNSIFNEAFLIGEAIEELEKVFPLTAKEYDLFDLFNRLFTYIKVPIEKDQKQDIAVTCADFMIRFCVYNEKYAAAREQDPSHKAPADLR